MKVLFRMEGGANSGILFGFLQDDYRIAYTIGGVTDYANGGDVDWQPADISSF